MFSHFLFHHIEAKRYPLYLLFRSNDNIEYRIEYLKTSSIWSANKLECVYLSCSIRCFILCFIIAVNVVVSSSLSFSIIISVVSAPVVVLVIVVVITEEKSCDTNIQ